MRKGYYPSIRFLKEIIVIILMIIGFTSSSYAQLTGVKTIPGSYASLAAAITDLNTAGVGTGGVTFNIAAGYTETFTDTLSGLITATGTATDQIIFQKSGSGANPLITAQVGRSLTIDGIIIIAGGDYITFDAIDLQENVLNTTATTQMEWGYALVKGSATAPFNGCQYVTIKNCSITLNKANVNSRGIYAGVHTAISATLLTITATSDAMNNCKFNSNTISNVYMGFWLLGYNASTPFNLYDQNNEIGSDGGNTVTNFGGGSVAVYGISVGYQNNIKIINNTVNGGAGTTSTLYGILTSAGTNASATVTGNTVTVTCAGTTTSLAGIYNTTGSTGTNNTITITNNTVQNCTYPTSTTGGLYGIVNTASPANVIMFGNTVANNTKAGTSGSFYCMQSSAAATTEFYSNSIHDNSITAGTGTLYGYYNSAASVTETYHDNNIYNLVHGGTGTVYGMNISTTSGVKNSYKNIIHGLSSAGGTVYGFLSAYGAPHNFYKNQIYDLSATLAAGIVYGVSLSPTTLNMYNNYIYDLRTPGATGSNAIVGINITGGTTANVYYNTVYINATSSSATTFGSSGLSASSTPVLDLRNNLIVNTSTPVGTSFTAAYRRSSTTLTSYSALSTSNGFYAGTPGAKNVIFYDGTNSDQTITLFKSRVAPRDGSSFSELPNFVTVSGNPCRINAAIPTQIEGVGIPVTTPISVTDDFFLTVRNTTTPDVGAEEFTGTTIDLTSPSIFYTALFNTSILTARTLIATITDAGGVPVSGTGLPVLYWNKNNGSYTAVTGSSIGNNQYTFTFGAGVVVDDTVRYYIAAQDNAVTPNVGCYPSIGASGFTASPPAVSTPPSAPSLYKIIGSLSGTFNIPGNYATLTEAAASINSLEITGNITLILGASYTSASETFPVVFNANSGSSATQVLTIKPAAAVTISGSSTTSLIKFNGFDYAVLDGSSNGTSSKELTISNTSTTGTGIHVSSLGTGAGASNITIKNCNILSGSGTTSGSYGISVGGSTTATAGDDNDNITIQNNSITKCYTGIFIKATVSGVNNNSVILGNTIGSEEVAEYVGKYGIDAAQLDGATISQNIIKNFIGSTTNPIAMNIASGIVNTVISRNNIHGIRYTGSGGYGGKALDINTGIAASNLTITNNLIYDISGDGYSNWTSDAIVGIRIQGNTGGLKIYYNSVNLFGNVSRSTATADASGCLYIPSTAVNVDVRNNVFRNSIENTSGVAKAYAIYCAGTNAVFSSINFNDYFVAGPEGVLGYLTSDLLTIAELRTATGQDVSSKAENPSFLDNVDLRINIGSPLLLSATHIPAVTIDYTGVTRSTVTPSIGAYENSINGGPSISYTQLGNTFNNGNISLNDVLMTDVDGIATGTLKPRVYWKVNSGSWTSAAAINDASPYNFTIATSGLIVSDTIKYYVIAQDLLGYVSASPGNGLVATDVNTVTVHPANAYSYKIISNPNYGGGQTGTGGYFFANSTPEASGAPSMPLYAWIDPVANTHTEITTWNTSGDDGVTAAIPIPFNFTYFDTVRTNLFVCANGWLSFTDPTPLSTSIRRTPVVIPTAGGIENYITAALMDLDVTTATYPDAHVYYGGDNSYFAITFLHAHKYSSTTDYLSFQIILKANGNIKIQYNRTESTATLPISITNASAAGIENYGTAGIQYRLNGAGGPVLDSTSIAIEFGMNAGNLPVELTSFTAVPNERTIVLNWETKTELNSRSFIIERSSDLKIWNSIGELNGKGNSSVAVKYSFTDKNLTSGKFSYRLRMVDLDGKVSFSNVIESEIGLPKTYSLSQNYPNPFNPTTKIQYQIPVAAKVTVELFSITGEKVAELVNLEQEAGYYTLDVNAAKNFASGVYIYRMIAVDKVTGNNFVNVKKMMMLK